MKNPKNKRIQIYEKGLKEKARHLRRDPTPAETLFWNTLRKMPFYSSLTFNRQKPLGNFIVDFYCHKRKLIVEIDGDSHGGDGQKVYDQKRKEFLESLGLREIRFSNREVIGSIEGVMLRLEEALEEQAGKSPQPPSRKGEF